MSIWRKRTLEMPRCSARRCAAESISGAKSLVISVPPGWIRLAARNPVSPIPAARSRIVCPGCGAIASTIAVETGSESLPNLSACFSQPSAARTQRSRASSVMAALQALDDVVDAGGERLDVLRLDGGEHGDAQLVAAELAVGLDVDDPVGAQRLGH